MQSFNEILSIAQKIVRGSFINFNLSDNFINFSGIYRWTNEDITSYYHHFQNKNRVLSVIGSGNQILNGILAGTRNLDCFDISVFPKYYLFLHIASIISLNKEEYIKYYFSENRNELFSENIYDKISINLKGNIKVFWDNLYDYNNGCDIFFSMLFRQDFYSISNVIENNPYLQDNNYEKLKSILKNETIKLNNYVCNILTTKFSKEYDLINLSNILYYYFNNYEKKDYIKYLKNNFVLKNNGEIINYFYTLSNNAINEFNCLIGLNGYIEDIRGKKLLVYKK